MDNALNTLAEQEADPALLDVAEPDAEYLLATEREEPIRPHRRALVALVRDREDEHAEGIDQLLPELLNEAGFHIDAVVTVRSKRSQIRQAIETAVIGGVDLVLTVGGTGVGPRDKTPEATRAVLDQVVPGIAQAMRASGLAGGVLDACTSRGISGVSGSTVVVNLASSPEAVRDGVAVLAPLAHFVINQYSVE
ncbi:Molybdenum cofactor biosynthesis protein B [Corynebacterium occultum]|uniref:Molybdenum cofactor biosynthesis protein B n=1 Tax=Corynebacterium occultum TaxID=2675219 RepID=A0A6B8W633_9CORY|nr:molybdopterin-binding protein [Corynebacterium occultum]QGU06765.1 Molybdenum cofactor biosynthesis protein B [Corynebacterium occultum]